MKKTTLLYKIGSLAFMLFGLMHTGGLLFSQITTEQSKVLDVMQNFIISLPGRDSNLFLFHEGFSYMMGMLLIGYGTLNLALVYKNSELILLSRSLILINIIVSLIAVVICVKYFSLFQLL